MKTPIKVALIALLWITAINSGELKGGDTEPRLKMTHALWTGTEEISLPPNYQPPFRGHYQAGVLGAGGKRYIVYDIGQSLLMLPGDWLGTKLHRWFPAIEEQFLRSLVVNFLVFIPLNVAAVVSCFWLLRLFDFNERIAGLTSITWLLGTTVFHYSQIQQQNNQVLLFVTIGYAAALACALLRNPRFACISGLALGAALVMRITSTIHILTVLLFLIGCIAYQSRDKSQIIKVVGLWLVGFIPLALVGKIFDYIRYGSFWINGQSLWVKQLNTDPIWSGLPEIPANYPLTNPPHVGILGVLFSPVKSIFIYDPLLLPCLVLGIVFWQRLSPYIQWYLVTGIFNLALHMVLTSRLIFWGGDSSWGARYHVTSIHLLLIPLLALFIQTLLSARRLKAWLMRGLILLAILVQITSVTMLPSLERAQARIGTPGSRFEFRLGMRVTNIVCKINDSFSEKCIDRLSPEKKRYLASYPYNEVLFLPFTFSRKAVGNPVLIKFVPILFVVWGLVLILAIGTTVRFCYLG